MKQMQLFPRRENEVNFIHEKIMDLQTALFIPQTESEYCMTTYVVTMVEMDQSGNVWFAIPRPSQLAACKNFDAKMDFFKKGLDFYLKVDGHATLISDPEEINEVSFLTNDIKQRMQRQELVIVRVAISQAEYFEAEPKPVMSSWFNTTPSFKKWFSKPAFFNRKPRLQPIPVPVMR